MNMNQPVGEKRRPDVGPIGPTSRLRAFILLAITIGGLVVCYFLTLPFLSALVWALALAILCAPLHRWLETKLKSPGLAAFISVFWIGLVVVAPAIWLGSWLVAELASAAVALKDRAASGDWQRFLERHAALSTLLPWIDQWDLPETVGRAATSAAAATASLVRGWALQLITIVLTFYFLFYFLRDRALALDWLQEISPLSAADTRLLFERIVDAIQATFYGTVVVAAIQGTLGGLIFWSLGLPAPLVWGSAMALLAIVPMLGAFIIWAPAAIFFILEGHWTNAVVLIAWGTLVIGSIDNLLYPILVGDRLKLHTVPAFISILGGVIMFGAAGLLLGPLVVTTVIVLLEIWRVPITNRSI
jgi:predicted PurR-regulated permease PerM